MNCSIGAKFLFKPIFFSDKHYLWRENHTISGQRDHEIIIFDQPLWPFRLEESIRNYSNIGEKYKNHVQRLYNETMLTWHRIAITYRQIARTRCNTKYRNYKWILSRIRKEYPSVSSVIMALKKWRSLVLCNTSICYCGKRVETAHHIFYKIYYPGLALNPNNGIGLCKECHMQVHMGEFSR